MGFENAASLARERLGFSPIEIREEAGKSSKSTCGSWEALEALVCLLIPAFNDHGRVDWARLLKEVGETGFRPSLTDEDIRVCDINHRITI